VRPRRAASRPRPAGNDPKIRCQVVSLYRGGQFKLYKFRKYSDVRLAWAPEDRAATFGGDLDNFSFPRFAIDAAFIRLYEDGKPAATPTHFTWNPNKPTEGEPVFVTGNPGSTQRLLTQAQLMTIRDVVLPLDQLIASELRGRLIRYSEEGEEQAFIAMDPIVGVENTYKRGRGRMAALIDPAFMDQLAGQETVFHRRVAENEALSAEVGDPWAALAEVQPIARELYAPMALLEGGTGMGTTSVAGRLAAVQLGAGHCARGAGARQAVGPASARVRRQPPVRRAVQPVRRAPDLSGIGADPSGVVAVQDPRMADRRQPICPHPAGQGKPRGPVGAPDHRHQAG
jgi:hypothetical protein